MGHHSARVEWNRGEAKFMDNRYSRAHQWSFDGGVRVPASTMKTVTLRPAVTFGAGPRPSRVELEALHHEAHDACYLSSSVRTEILVESV